MPRISTNLAGRIGHNSTTRKITDTSFVALYIETTCGDISLGPIFDPIYPSPQYVDLVRITPVTEEQAISNDTPYCGGTVYGQGAAGGRIYTSVSNGIWFTPEYHSFELLIDTDYTGEPGVFTEHRGRLVLYRARITFADFRQEGNRQVNEGNVSFNVSEDGTTLDWSGSFEHVGEPISIISMRYEIVQA